MTRASLVVSTVATLMLPTLPLRAGDGPDKPAATKQCEGIPRRRLRRRRARLLRRNSSRSYLDEALKMIRTPVNPPAVAGFPGRSILLPDGLSKEIQADAILRIGRARAKLGDRAGTRAACQTALDATAEIDYHPEGRTALYVDIARAQFEAGDRDELRFTLRQAIQSARSITGQPGRFPLPPVVLGLQPHHLVQKADALRKVAEIQSKVGESAAAGDTLSQALEAANAIKEPLNQISALLRIAQCEPAEVAKSALAKALEIAMSAKDEFSKAKAIETVLRARVRALQVNEALALVADRLNGDLQHYSLWVVADAVASSDRPVAPESMARLTDLARKAKFDHPSKKLKVFRRLAEAHARLGDYEAAYRSVGEPQPANNIDTFRATQARIQVMKAVAEAQLKAKHREAARNTVYTALEMIAPLPDADAEAYFPLAELGMIQANAGDQAGAVRTADALNSSLSKVKVFGEVAAAYAREGRREDARKSIRRALDAARHVPNDTLWNNSLLYFQSAQFAQGIDPMLPALQLLAPAQARADDLEGALKSVAEMGTSPGSRYNRTSTIGHILAAQHANRTIGQIVAARLAVGDIAGARKAIESIPDSNAITTYIPAEQDSDRNDIIPDELTGGRPPLLERVARQQAEQGDPAVVLDWVRKESKPNTQLRMLRGLADGIAARSATKAEGAKTGEPGAQAKPGD